MDEISAEIVDLNATIGAVAELLCLVASRDLILRTKLDPDLARIQATHRQMEWLFVNLVARAYDTMMPSSELTITTSNVRVEEAPGACVQVELIMTSGCIETGTAARDIIRRAGGLVSANSSSGCGSRLTILFPAA